MKSSLIDCISEDDLDGSWDEEHSASVAPVKGRKRSSTKASKKADSSTKTTTTPLTPTSATTTTTPAIKLSTPAASPMKKHGNGVLEYVVDQKGIGSETLVVKSAANKNNCGSPKSAINSRRNSFISSSPTKQQPPSASIPTPSQLHLHALSYNMPMTTQSHPLFPNYPRTMTAMSNALPTIDGQFDFSAIANDLGLAALNVNDFNINTWNAHTAYDSYPQVDMPRYHSGGGTDHHSSNTILHNNNNNDNLISYNSMNNIVSDLFGDIGLF